MTIAQPTDDRASIGIGYYLAVLRRGGWFVLAGLVLGGLASIGYLSVVASAYTASTLVNVNVISTDPFGSSQSASGLLDASTEQEIAGSYVVAEQASESLGPSISPSDLRAGVEVQPIADATVIRITSTGDSPSAAQDQADALAGAYLDYRGVQAEERRQAILDNLDETITGRTAELAQANQDLSAAEPGSAAADSARTDIDVIELEIEGLQAERSGLASIDTAGGSVLNPAVENDVVATPSARMILVAGLLAGAVLGVLAAFTLPRLTGRVRGTIDFVHTTQLPVLARLAGRTAEPPLATFDLDQLRGARERILADADLGAVPVLLIIDTTSAPRGASVCPQLAAVFAQDGRRVQVVMAGVSDEVGARLADALSLRRTGESDQTSTYVSTVLPQLTYCFAAADGDPSQPDSLITSRVRDSLAPAARREAMVVLVLPPGAPRSSRLAAARTSDASVLVIEERFSRTTELVGVLQDMGEIGAPTLGAVLVPRRRRRARTRDARAEARSGRDATVRARAARARADDAGKASDRTGESGEPARADTRTASGRRRVG